ncbi:sensor histidine kinase [Neobacillus muris]|uniref:sensor histidine kinase n=1 Tax=Neobacillus muris TaxID=2941334 RepID=UPI0020414D58|nr:sensor histidine kinase [Neobacillus muris]
MDQRKWYWLDTILFLFRTLWIFYNAYSFLSISNGLIFKWILFFAFMAIYLVPLLFYRPGSINVLHYYLAEWLLTSCMFLFLMYRYHSIDVYNFIFLPSIMIGYAAQLRPLIWIAPLLSLLNFVIGTWAGDQFTENFLDVFIYTTFCYLIGFCLGRVTVVNNKEKKLIESIQEKNKMLEQYSRIIEELTIVEERNRISQELDHTVDHILTSVVTNLDELPSFMKTNREGAENVIKEISELAREGLYDVRKTIHQMSPIENRQTLIQSFHEVMEDFLKNTETQVDFQIRGSERVPGERIKYTLIRCLQEGLTNAIRHGQAAEIKVKLSFEEEAIRLFIQDNGLGFDPHNLGFGLQTIKERIHSLGGTFAIESKVNSGTKIGCSVPLAK